MDGLINVGLTEPEWNLIQGIRALPESPLRERVHDTLFELLFYIANPRCQGMGVEGFPCGDPRSSCEDCHRIWDLLDQISFRARRNE
jgi:hypothetical protein